MLKGYTVMMRVVIDEEDDLTESEVTDALDDVLTDVVDQGGFLKHATVVTAHENGNTEV